MVLLSSCFKVCLLWLFLVYGLFTVVVHHGLFMVLACLFQVLFVYACCLLWSLWSLFVAVVIVVVVVSLFIMVVMIVVYYGRSFQSLFVMVVVCCGCCRWFVVAPFPWSHSCLFIVCCWPR